jgi:hypothetical protein
MYLNWPSGLAATAIVSAPAAGALVVLVELVVAGVAVVAGVDADELVLLEELPQPVSASRPRASASIESVIGEDFFARAAICGFTAGPPIFGA